MGFPFGKKLDLESNSAEWFYLNKFRFFSLLHARFLLGFVSSDQIKPYLPPLGNISSRIPICYFGQGF